MALPSGDETGESVRHSRNCSWDTLCAQDRLADGLLGVPLEDRACVTDTLPCPQHLAQLLVLSPAMNAQSPKMWGLSGVVWAPQLSLAGVSPSKGFSYLKGGNTSTSSGPRQE